MMFVLAFLAGSAAAALILVFYQDWATPILEPSLLRDFLSWVGALVRDFTPWAAIVIGLLVWPKSRAPLRQLGKSLGTLVHDVLVSNDIEKIKFGDLLEITTARASKDPLQARKLLEAQIDVIESKFNDLVDNEANKLSITTKCELLFKDYILPLIDQKQLKAGERRPRVTIHMEDPLYKNGIFQIIDYLPAADHAGTSKYRRYSVRYGIVGLAWRRQSPCYDPNVSLDRDRLVETWGMTKDEASKAGKGRQSHLALPIPQDNPHFVLFFDAPPPNIFRRNDEDRENEIFVSIYSGIDESGLKLALQNLWDVVKAHEPIVDKKRGP